jgi:hypothetical protein
MLPMLLLMSILLMPTKIRDMTRGGVGRHWRRRSGGYHPESTL